MTRFELATTGPPDLDNYAGIFVYMLDFVYLCTDNQSFNKQSKRLYLTYVRLIMLEIC